MNVRLILLLTIIAVCYGKPLDSSKDAKILKYENEIGENGMYKFSFETSDGTIRQETGTLQKRGDEEILIVRGAYSFLDDKGERHVISYTADDNGYRPVEIKPDDVPVLRTLAGGPVNRIDADVIGSIIGSGVR